MVASKEPLPVAAPVADTPGLECCQPLLIPAMRKVVNILKPTFRSDLLNNFELERFYNIFIYFNLPAQLKNLITF